jgi:hypothetical protein
LRCPTIPANSLANHGANPLGAVVANLSPALAEELRIDSSTEGVVVIDGSVAQGFGFLKGHIVVSVNNAKIAIMRDLLRAISQPVRLWRLTILRNGKEISAAFGG